MKFSVRKLLLKRWSGDFFGLIDISAFGREAKFNIDTDQINPRPIPRFAKMQKIMSNKQTEIH